MVGRPLDGLVALVSGAIRGVGRGLAVGLSEAGAVVYATGRTLRISEEGMLGGSLERTAADAAAVGGVVIPVRADHTDDDATRLVLERIQDEQGRLDVLVNNAWSGYEHFWDDTEHWLETSFWKVPLSRWAGTIEGGVRIQYVTSVLAAPLLLASRGILVNISSDAAVRDEAGVLYSVAKAASDRMVVTMAHELRPHGVAAVAVWPGLVRTEGVLRAATFFDLTDSQSPWFVGRCVAALAADPGRLELSGASVTVAELARRHGVVEPDPYRPPAEPGPDPGA